MLPSLIIVISRGVKSTLAKIIITLKHRQAGTCTFPSQKIISLCCIFTLHCPHNGVVMLEHNAQCGAKIHHLSEGLPQRSCCSPPAHIQPSHAPLDFLDWECGKPSEGMDCAMNGSHCVIFTFPGSSPLVFNYNNSLARSDKVGDVAIRHDNSPQPEWCTSSAQMKYISHLLFYCLPCYPACENNRRANEREEQ